VLLRRGSELSGICQRGRRDPPAAHPHPFGSQPAGLFAVLARGGWKHNAPAGADDAVPWQAERFRRHAQCKSGVARAPR